MAKTSNTELDKAMRQIEKVLTDRYQNAQGIRREGNVIVLPEKGSLNDHISTLSRYRDALEEMMNTEVHLDAHPDDALYALYKVIEEKFGQLMSAMSFSFFGPRPGEQRTIQISTTETMVVPVGKTEIFGSLPVTLYVYPEFDRSSDVGGWVNVTFQHPRKWEPFIKEIEDEVRSWLARNSIFKNKAINSDFSFLDLRYFDPLRRIVYSREERLKLFGEVFAPIIATEQWLLNGGTLKRGALLYGDYGTGKSLTLMYIAKLCEKHNWTFINVKPGDDINRVLRFAKRYQPAVVAVEDIDRDAGRKRTDEVNNIINQFDSVVSKGDQVMVVMTTNSRENIQPAMLRPGRIDTSVEMGVLDAQAVRRLVENELMDENGDSVLDGELDEQALFEAAQGYTNAFVVEGVKRAKGYAIARKYELLEGNFKDGDGHIRITAQDVVGGLTGLRDQWKLMKREDNKEVHTIDSAIMRTVETAIGPVTNDVNLLVGKVGLRK